MANTPKTLYKSKGTEITFIDTSKEVKKAIEKLHIGTKSGKDTLGRSINRFEPSRKGEMNYVQ